jgi:hypothetical protein
LHIPYWARAVDVACGARRRCDLLRGMAGLRLRGLSSGIVELPVNVLASFAELIHALPQAPRQIRQLFRPEEDKNDEEDDTLNSRSLMQEYSLLF